MNKQDNAIYWVAQRDLIASIFMVMREENKDEKETIQSMARLYNNHFDGKAYPNPHIEHYLNK
jgi:hypothetical protein